MCAVRYKLRPAFFKNRRYPMESSFKKTLKETGLFLADILYNAIIIIVLVILIRSFLISPFRVVGSSMADTLENEEFILIDKLSYWLGDVSRGDPVVFLPPATSKDTPKFEDLVTMNRSGIGNFNFSALSKVKDVNYCRKFPLRVFWFCRERVEEGDLLYYAPQEGSSGDAAKQTHWNTVKSVVIDESSADEGHIQLDGAADTPYAVRIYSSRGQEYYVKRIIGIPGDLVKIEDGRVYVKRPEESDFVQIREAFLNQENANRTYISQFQRQNIYEVPKGQYFVLGDNRNHSNDSRSWLEPITQDAFPFVPEANISGKVLVVLWPLTHFRFLSSADLLPLNE